ncbi:MAG: SLAC1 anion channel family protein [Zoogloea sp.]|uniref:SLAC1 anion channel family protein n=1 Tax=Zoogloea sp. TaxID=49181 RepID=UPI002601626E|nr:SLAC1 anion channel family protein [Zoogloea sp.]MDD3325972.1 SLAC1 anion channel family protein [Zoogloea sp.]
MQAPTATSPHPAPSLAHFPVALFSTVMGTGGLALAWHKAAGVLGWPSAVGQGLTLLASLLLVIVGLLYALKWLRHPAEARAERKHPVKMNFVPTLSIGILLVAGAWLPSSPAAALPLWTLGALLHLSFTLVTMSAWIHHDHFEIQHLNPAWFVPVVGNIIVPLAGVHLAPVEISWFFFSIGVVFWIVLLAVVMYRLFFHAPLALRLTPTLFILLAPPSVGFVAWSGLVGGLDAFGRVLYYTALFLALLLVSNAMRFFKLPFFVSAWAYSFPLAALSTATLRMAELGAGAFFAMLGGVLLILTTGVIGLLAARTIQAILRQEIGHPE